MDQIWGSVTQYTEIHWGWPIAVYLFIAGMSAGAMIAALLLKWKSGGSYDGLVKAGAILAPTAIMIGLGLLIVDLSKPLSFWLLMLHYQLNSIMSIGVILLMVYSGLAVLFAAIVLKDDLCDYGWAKWWFKPLVPVIEWFESWGRLLEWSMCLFAVSIAVYTGFLLSAIGAKPLLNMPILPLLFLISGMSAGVAASIVVGVTVYRDSVSRSNLQYLLSLDTKLIPAELFTLFLMFGGLLNMGGQYAIVAKQALSVGIWAQVFWIGVVGAGLVVPMILAFTSLHKAEASVGNSVSLAAGQGSVKAITGQLSLSAVLVNSALVLTGVFLLRCYIVYAGQIFY
ncbi:MAG: NrfD/PsrC family molybdoenzyme membrane anchor subunit, partial [Sporomusa sp.]